jgi:DUF1680 family protein
MYITGSIGSTEYGEAFSFDYDLPNDTIYGETCAAIGLIFFARRMLEIETDSRYSDVMERALYNGVISGMSLDGKSFFYVNPLEAFPEASEKDFNKSHVKVERQKWFGCACCPPNMARLLASLASYAYTLGNDNTLFIHLYMGGHFSHAVNNHQVDIQTVTRYPWDGAVDIQVRPESGVESFSLVLRIPGWCSSYRAELNGGPLEEKPKKGYLKISRTWKAGDILSLKFDMPVMVNMSHPLVRENTGKVAVSRGPLIYCLEEADNGKNLHLFSLDENPGFKCHYEKDLLGGIEVINSRGFTIEAGNGWDENTLYRPVQKPALKERQLTWIPYYAWANRGPGEMRVWIPRREDNST